MLPARRTHRSGENPKAFLLEERSESFALLFFRRITSLLQTRVFGGFDEPDAFARELTAEWGTFMPWVLSTPDRSSYLCEKCNRFERGVGRIERGAGCLGGGRVCLGAKLVGAGGKLGGCRGRLFGLRVERGALWAERARRRVFPRAGRPSGQLVACSGWVDIES